MTPSDLAWLRALPAVLEAAPGAAALALGLAAGLGLVLFLAFAPRAKSRPLPLLILPGAPLAAACFGQIWILGAASLPAAPIVDRLERGGPALLQAHTVAAAGLALGALLLLATAAALALSAGPPRKPGAAGATPPAPSAALLPLACAVLAVPLLVFAYSLLAPDLMDGAPGAGEWANGAALRLRDMASNMRIGALVWAPLLLALGVVARSSRGALRSARRELVTLAVAAGAPALLSAAVAVAASRDLAGLWSAAIPQGFSAGRAPAGAPLCADVDAEHTLFIGPARLVLGRRDLGAISDLVSDEGLSAAVFAVDKALGKETLFIAADSHVRFGSVERLLRALAERQVRGAPAGLRRFMRRPRCEVVLLGASAGDASFPLCRGAQLASVDCPAPGPDDRTLLVLAGDSAYYHHAAVPFAIERVSLHYDGPRDAPDAPYLPHVSRSLAASEEVPAQDLFELAVPQKYRDAAPMLAPRLVAVARIPEPGPPLSPIAASPLVVMETVIRPYTEPGMPASLRDAVASVTPALRTCIERPEVQRGHADVHLLIGADGAVRRVLHQTPIPGDADCVLRTLAGLRFAVPRETVMAVEIELAVRRARALIWSPPISGVDYLARRGTLEALRKHNDEALACYAPALLAGREQLEFLVDEELDTSGKPSRVTIVTRRDHNDQDLEPDPQLDACVTAVLAGAVLPVAADRSRRVYVRFTPP